MTGDLPHLEHIFPFLASSGYSPKSPRSSTYNCIAYAAGDESRKWAGFRGIGYYWPEGAIEGYGFDALISAFEQLGYSVCHDGAMEPGFEKVALFRDREGFWTHAAKQSDDGQWTSKLGDLEDIVHTTPQAVSGRDPAYGEVTCFMKRKRRREGLAEN
jgi:hypothetical protein